jgi:hypothetical protein
LVFGVLLVLVVEQLFQDLVQKELGFVDKLSFTGAIFLRTPILVKIEAN